MPRLLDFRASIPSRYQVGVLSEQERLRREAALLEERWRRRRRGEEYAHALALERERSESALERAKVSHNLQLKRMGAEDVLLRRRQAEASELMLQRWKEQQKLRREEEKRAEADFHEQVERAYDGKPFGEYIKQHNARIGNSADLGLWQSVHQYAEARASGEVLDPEQKRKANAAAKGYLRAKVAGLEEQYGELPESIMQGIAATIDANRFERAAEMIDDLEKSVKDQEEATFEREIGETAELAKLSSIYKTLHGLGEEDDYGIKPPLSKEISDVAQSVLDRMTALAKGNEKPKPELEGPEAQSPVERWPDEVLESAGVHQKDYARVRAELASPKYAAANDPLAVWLREQEITEMMRGGK